MRSKKARITAFFAAATVITLLFALGIFLGSVRLGFFECVRGLFLGEGKSGVIVRSLRLPRTVAALLCGAALATSGSLLQGALNNDLAAPNVIGVNSGAGAFVMLSLCFFSANAALESSLAFVGALFAAFLSLGASTAVNRELSRSSVVLAGVAVSAVFSAVISYLSLRFPDAVSSYAAFSVGGFSGIYLSDLTLPSLIIAVGLMTSVCLTPRLNLLALGDDLAASFGVRVGTLRAVSVVIAAALASASVSFAGLIGFVGLIAPHVSERLVGSDKRLSLPMSALVGAALCLLADILSRVLFAPSEIATGVLLNVVGASFFLGLLIMGGRRENR